MLRGQAAAPIPPSWPCGDLTNRWEVKAEPTQSILRGGQDSQLWGGGNVKTSLERSAWADSKSGDASCTRGACPWLRTASALEPTPVLGLIPTAELPAAPSEQWAHCGATAMQWKSRSRHPTQEVLPERSRLKVNDQRPWRVPALPGANPRGPRSAPRDALVHFIYQTASR